MGEMRDLRHYVAAVLAAVFIGSVGILIHTIGGAVPIMTVTFLRLGIGAAFMGGVGLLFDKSLFKIKGRDVMNCAFVGLLIAIAISLFHIAFTYLTVAQVYLMDAMFPFFIILFVVHAFREKIYGSDILALVAGAVGVMIMSPLSFVSTLGTTIMFIKIIVYASELVYLRKGKTSSQFKSTFWYFAFATLFLLPFPLVYGFGDIGGALLPVALLGIVVTGVGSLCLNFARRGMYSEELSIILVTVTTLTGVASAVLLAGETLAPHVVIGGCVLVFAGCYINWMRLRGIGKKKGEAEKGELPFSSGRGGGIAPATQPGDIEKRKMKNFFLNREPYMIVGMIGAVLLMTTLGFFALWAFIKPLFVWVVAVLAIFFTRRTDLWYLGMEIHFPLAFLMTYAFGLWFSIPMILASFYLVFKARPDQGTGVIVQLISLSVMMLLANYFQGIYGASITLGQFSFAFLISIILVQILDAVLSVKLAPAPVFKVAVAHTLDVVVNYYVMMFIGYQALKFFFTIQG